MRIGFITHQWPGVRLGGIGAYTLHCARALTEASSDLEVHVFTMTLPRDVSRDLGPRIRIHEVSGVAERVGAGHAPRGYAAALATGGEAVYRLAMADLLCAEVLRVHRDTPFDIVEGPEYEGLTYPLATREGERPAIVTHLHSGSAIARHAWNLSPGGEQSLRESLEFFAIQRSDGLCGPSHAVIHDTRAAYGEDVAVEAEILPLPFPLLPQGYSAPPRGGAVLYVGRLELLKGAHLLAEAGREFLGSNPQAALRIVGPDTATAPDSLGKSSGKSMAAWMKQRLGGSAADRVTFLGEQDQVVIREELRQCSFVVIPSLRESYSYVCCEALAAGRAVVVSEQTGAAEVAGEAGVRFVQGDAGDLARRMGELWRDEARRERLSRAAWERASGVLSGRRTIDARIAFYERVIRRAAEGRRGGPSRGPGSGKWSGEEMRCAGYLAWLRGREEEGKAMIGEAGGGGFHVPSIDTPGTKLLAALAHARHWVRGGAMYFYGAGRHTARLLVDKQAWEAQGYVLCGIIDDHARYQPDHGRATGEAQQSTTPEADFHGIPVMPLSRAMALLGPGDLVVLSSDAFEEQMWQRTESLRAKGIAVCRLYG